MQFKEFAKLVADNLATMQKGNQLYKVKIPKDELWEIYLNSFPKGTNPIFKERTEYDCNCCKNFIRDVGNVVTISAGNITSIWDVETTGPYDKVAKKLADYVKKQYIKNVFSVHQAKIGNITTHQDLGDGQIKTWNHFHGLVERNYVQVDGSILSDIESTVNVFKRGLEEITEESATIVLDLIDQNTLYRGSELKESVSSFKRLKNQYLDLNSSLAQNHFVWLYSKTLGARIRNTAIGTLLQDISDNVDLDRAVSSFESKVAPTNYKRPKALITEGMIKTAMATINVLGIEQSLYRRFAVTEDISVNNVLFVDRNIAPQMKDSLEDMLQSEAKVSKKDFSKIEDITIEKFVSDVLPNVDSIEAMLDNKHNNNLMSLIAPKDSSAPNILKWNNNFSWDYKGNVADSIKERVKTAGGDVTGVLRFSIQWNEEGNDGHNDLDAHCKLPGGHIYFSSQNDYRSGGVLDIDITNPQSQSPKGIAVENITWAEINKMPNGEYKFSVHNFSGTNKNGFRAEIEMNGLIHNFEFNGSVEFKHFINVATVILKDGIFTIKNHLDSTTYSKEVWNLKTQDFQKVQLLTISPNHWDNNEVGNKHYFFILEGCKVDEQPRGFYNEFLNGKFDKHRKVFEVLGSKTKCEMSDIQLSGLGFSTTQRNELIVKVKGNFTRTLNIKF